MGFRCKFGTRTRFQVMTISYMEQEQELSDDNILHGTRTRFKVITISYMEQEQDLK
jgi:hypothetical protein